MSEHGANGLTPLALNADSPASGLGWASNRCIRSRPYNLACERCIAACPEQALTFIDEGQGPRPVASDACHGCGACVPSCPTEALLSNDLQQLERRIQGAPSTATITLRCHRAERIPEAHSLHCLRVVAPDQLLQWRSAHPGQEPVLCVAEDCRHCPAAPANDSQDEWLHGVSAVSSVQFRGQSEFRPAEGAVLGRRSFLTGAGPVEPTLDETEPRARAVRQQRAHVAARQLESQALPSLPRITLDPERCSAHGVCASVCPVSALTATPEGALRFSPLECIECGFCLSSCPEQALSHGLTEDAEPVVLRQTTYQDCFECGRAFPVGEDANTNRSVCPACRRDRSLFEDDFRKLFG